ncbi:ABC-type transport auxiliary lipoprotein family protein [Variovorax dokdonensis]|uniref:ABC-type transport auxiliary lipoprotein family protein n=1 Tax=Variovorax dokdonensis TaxID=344883 RepID=A0ABT7NG43_9BURK|nr:ABC-type transport auxiliary lipoprotein family protein [Variovorax dokdonensis]MDM0046840.1 ABC-type transport auxiliary lipoprotein family protein [Variovorax dokdonensis]
MRLLSHMQTRGVHAGTAALAVLAALLMSGCGALPDKPARATLYDFGAGPLAQASTTSPEPVAAPTLPPLLLAGVNAQPRLDGTQVLYRLGYGDANELRPYANARWSVAPTQLLGDRLRDVLSRRRVVLGSDEGANVARVDGRSPNTLYLTLDEFSQYFESTTSSFGLVRVRATLLSSSTSGDRVLGQRYFNVRQPAPTADAPGGVKALATASDQLVSQVAQWVDSIQAQPAR